MMTLKLVAEGRARIYEAVSFTITEELFQTGAYYCRKITAHDIIGAHATLDDCWWVGFPPYDVEDNRVYTSAFIMNTAGKTVEVLSSPFVNQTPSQVGVPQSIRSERPHAA